MPEQERPRADRRARARSSSCARSIHDRTFEIRQPMLAGDERVRLDPDRRLDAARSQTSCRSAFGTGRRQRARGADLSSIVAMLLAQWMLRPIHVIQSGLTRLGRGELDVALDLPEEEFKRPRQLVRGRQRPARPRSGGRARRIRRPAYRPSGGSADFESVMENLEDAVALFSPRGELIFSNAAMTRSGHRRMLPASHPATAARRADAGRPETAGTRIPGALQPEAPPTRAGAPAHDARHRGHERPVPGRHARARNIWLPEPGALDAELLAQAGRARPADGRRRARGEESAQRDDDSSRAAEAEADGSARGRHACRPGRRGESGRASISRSTSTSSSSEIRRLDEVVIGFLKFARPDELKLQPVQLSALITDVVTTAMPEAERVDVTVKTDVPPTFPRSTPTRACCARRCSTLPSMPARRCRPVAR